MDTVSDELSQELVKNGDTNAYYVSYFKNVAYESAKVQVGFASVQIDEMTYGIIVFQIPTV